ncbi:hypothetical protein PLESTF_001009900 [Pleodorina starrii]|nr:hypothetical protein PLESTF_001009900 [Pleodorina starrii]
MLLWLANFKLVALCLGRGPLTQPGLTLGQFTALLLWPIIPQTDEDGRVKLVRGGWSRAKLALKRLIWRVPENLAICLVAVFTLTHPLVPLFAKTYSAAFGVCCYCDLWANACAALIILLNRLDVAPSWDRPWLQTSLSNFWSRRWNLPTSSSLKHLVYEPLVEGRLVAGGDGPHTRSKAAAAHTEPAAVDGSQPPAPAAAAGAASHPDHAALAPAGPVSSPTAPAASENEHAATTNGDLDGMGADGVAAAPMKTAEEPTSGSAAAAGSRGRGRGHGGRGSASAVMKILGLTATFAVSGVMHEVLLSICTGDSSQLGKQVIFFAIQAPLMILEQRLVKALAKARIHLPTWLCIPVASLTLQVPAMFWFWGAYFAAVQPRSSPLAPPPEAVAATVTAAAAATTLAQGAAAWATGFGLNVSAKPEL